MSKELQEQELSPLVQLLAKKENCMNKPNEEITLNIRPRPSENLEISIPKDTLESLKKIAHGKDTSLEALLKFYIGQGLRQDLAEQFSNPQAISHRKG